MFQTHKFTALCLTSYIMKTLKILGLNDSTKTTSTPFNQQINVDGLSPALNDLDTKQFMVAVGSFGWMANTCRPDIAYAHSRLAQHLSTPTESAWEAVIHLCDYLRGQCFRFHFGGPVANYI
jgi:hypothetical protein